MRKAPKDRPKLLQLLQNEMRIFNWSLFIFIDIRILEGKKKYEITVATIVLNIFLVAIFFVA